MGRRQSDVGRSGLNAARIAEAAKVAEKADLVILALGGNEQTSREAWAVNHPGDRDSLDLLGNQDDLVKAVLAPENQQWSSCSMAAPIPSTTLPSTSPPSLKVGTWARKAPRRGRRALWRLQPRRPFAHHRPPLRGQLPDYYYQKPSAKREYLGASTLPLFPSAGV